VEVDDVGGVQEELLWVAGPVGAPALTFIVYGGTAANPTTLATLVLAGVGSTARFKMPAAPTAARTGAYSASPPDPYSTVWVSLQACPTAPASAGAGDYVFACAPPGSCPMMPP